MTEDILTPDVLVELEYKKEYKGMESRFYYPILDDYVSKMISEDYVRFTILVNNRNVDSVNDKIDKVSMLNKGGWVLKGIKFKRTYVNSKTVEYNI